MRSTHGFTNHPADTGSIHRGADVTSHYQGAAKMPSFKAQANSLTVRGDLDEISGFTATPDHRCAVAAAPPRLDLPSKDVAVPSTPANPESPIEAA
jgi:hypothetical protein